MRSSKSKRKEIERVLKEAKQLWWPDPAQMCVCGGSGGRGMADDESATPRYCEEVEPIDKERRE